jgi:cation transport protein ChaC
MNVEKSGPIALPELDLIESRRIHPEPGKEFRVFAYGSLMWRPDFDFVDVVPALLYGYHRAFCITSRHYRGTAEHPGLVLGLDRGGMCRGRMFRVAPDKAPAVAEYLHGREMINSCYLPKWLKVRLPNDKETTALAYVADRKHPDYTGRLDDDRIVAAIGRASGVMGKNLDYLRNTVAHLDDMGIKECRLHSILRRLDAAG